jgi:hypothetical protein
VSEVHLVSHGVAWVRLVHLRYHLRVVNHDDLAHLEGIGGRVHIRDPVVHPPVGEDRRVVRRKDPQMRFVHKIVGDHFP